MGTRLGSVFAAALLAAGLLAGCGGQSVSNGLHPGPIGSSSASGSVTPSAGPGVTVTPSTAAPTGSHPVTVPSLPPRSFAAQGSETIVGDVEDGVEPNCVLLRTTSNKIYQLVGGDRTKLKGASKHVTVDGHELPAMATTCQQGIPFLVTDVHP
jgi:hypothetical protein